MKIKNFKQAEEFLLAHIPKTDTLRFPGILGVERAEKFLKLLGNPQDKLKVIHIAGTSGKGSTAYLLSSLLRAHGFRVGLALSPHVVDVRERCQINHALLDKEKFLKYLHEMLPAIKKMKKTQCGPLTYFELLVALAFYAFWKERVNYAVIETGLGGALDGTNVIHSRDKLCVITRIGKDHTRILGKTLKEIAAQKAGIIHIGNHVIALFQRKEINDTLKKRAKKQVAKIDFVKKNRDFFYLSATEHGTVFDFCQMKNIALSLVGAFQAENASLALACLRYLSQRDIFSVDEKRIRKTLQNISFPGRIEILRCDNKRIIVDGAHNPQKMAGLVRTLKNIYPGKKFVFLVAFKHKKDHLGILRKIIPVAKKIIVTDFFVKNQDLAWMSAKEEKIKKAFARIGYKKFIFIHNQEQALNTALSYDQDVVITGSLYFIGDIYTRIQKLKK